MTALFAYRRLASHVLASIVLLLAAAMTTPARAIDTVSVPLDQAILTSMPDTAATLVIGNPLIADVTVRPGGLLIVTGRSFGMTNLLVLDSSGAVLSERYIEVIRPRDEMVVVYRGVERESYSCMPDCQPRAVLGDSTKSFTDTLGLSIARANAALAAAASSKPK
jgi:Flp pilus assembly secretin CpaC